MGWMGATFSMLITLRSKIKDALLNDLKIQASYSFIVSRIFVGMGASLILFYAFQAGIIQGSFFPEFENVGNLVNENPVDAIVTHKNLAILIVWSFLAGFSEQLVPNMLYKTEKSLNEGTPTTNN